MKTIEEFAIEYSEDNCLAWTDLDNCTETDQKIIEMAVKQGVQFAESWIPVDEELPEVVEPVNGVYNNNDLLLVKWKTHGSIEFAVLIEDFGVKAWDIPDNGIVPIDEISGWRPINRK